MKTIKLIAIGVLIAFELLVVGLLLHPRVDSWYRGVFIVGTSECWPRNVDGRISFDQPISMLAKEEDLPPEAQAVLRCGWLNAQGEQGQLSVGPESRLLVQLPPAQAAKLDLDLRVFHQTQRIDITLNDQPLTEWTLPVETTQQTLQLPATADGRMEVGFHFRDAISPYELGLLADKRTLAITLRGLTLRKD